MGALELYLYAYLDLDDWIATDSTSASWAPVALNTSSWNGVLAPAAEAWPAVTIANGAWSPISANSAIWTPAG